jgi:hypothetical protein
MNGLATAHACYGLTDLQHVDNKSRTFRRNDLLKTLTKETKSDQHYFTVNGGILA